jgi:hypothetical protein
MRERREAAAECPSIEKGTPLHTVHSPPHPRIHIEKATPTILGPRRGVQIEVNADSVSTDTIGLSTSRTPQPVRARPANSFFDWGLCESGACFPLPLLSAERKITKDNRGKTTDLILQNGIGTRTQLSPAPTIAAMSCSVCCGESQFLSKRRRRAGTRDEGRYAELLASPAQSNSPSTEMETDSQ